MTIELSIIIPAYNEEANLRWIIDQVNATAEMLDVGYEVLIVDDGSSDRTAGLARELIDDHPTTLKLLSHPVNQGSGQAIRTGIEGSSGDFVIYVPADGQFDLGELGDYYRAALSADIVIGARIDRADYTWFRLLSSRVYIQLTNVVFGEKFQDVNWVHLWRRSLFLEIRPTSRGVYFLAVIDRDAAGNVAPSVTVMELKDIPYGDPLRGSTVGYEPAGQVY